MTDSRIMRRRGEGWAGVEPRAYKDVPGSHRDVSRHLLAGAGRDAGEGDAADLPFEVRAFRVEAGGFTSLERHAHPHSVVVLEGRGTVLLGRGEEERREELGPHDAVWVAPWQVHQFRADTGEALTFLCVVPAERDRPRPVEDAEDSPHGETP